MLTKGADFLVTGAASMARRWGISSLVIGLTIVAFGTSAPEFFVNMVSSINGTNGITIGNIIGSNLANVLLGIGIIAIIRPIAIQNGTAWKEIPFLMLATFLFWSNASDHIIDGTPENIITRSEAVMMVGLFVLFMVYTFGISKVADKQQGEDIEVLPLGKSLLWFFLGLVGLIIGGDIVVSSAIDIARFFDLSESLIGITIVAVGTSIPDIMTTIVAARKNNIGMAVGNIIGSNIFNILWVLAVSALIRPIPVERAMQPDLLLTLAVAVLLFIAFNFKKPSRGKKFRWSNVLGFVDKNHEISRWEGIVFVGLYAGYMGFLIWRG